MVSYSERTDIPNAYRFFVHVTGRALPAVDKALRLRCTLNAADHAVVSVSAIVVPLGTSTECDHVLQLVHEPTGENAPPRYFEVIASLAPTAHPTRRLRDAFATSRSSDGTEYRIAGMMDPVQGRVVLPEIVLRGA